MEASLVFKSSDGTQVGRVNGFSESDVAKVKQMISDVTTVSEKVAEVSPTYIFSTSAPYVYSTGTAGQIWFKYGE